MDDDGRGQSTATIEAKPQIKNVGGDVTRFMPTSLRIKREARDSKGRLLRPSGEMIVRNWRRRLISLHTHRNV